MKIDDIKRQPILLMFAVIIVIILLVGIFRTIAPYLSLGFGAYAHIGDVRGAISFETFQDGKGKVVIFVSNECGFCQELKADYDKASADLKNESDIEFINTIDPKYTELGVNVAGVPTIRFYKDELTKDNVNDSNAFVEFDGSDRTPQEIFDFLTRQRTALAAPPAELS